MLGLGTLAIDRCDGRTSALASLPQREKGGRATRDETGEKKADEAKRQLSRTTQQERCLRTTYDARVDPRASIFCVVGGGSSW